MGQFSTERLVGAACNIDWSVTLFYAWLGNGWATVKYCWDKLIPQYNAIATKLSHFRYAAIQTTNRNCKKDFFLFMKTYFNV